MAGAIRSGNIEARALSDHPYFDDLMDPAITATLSDAESDARVTRD